MIARVPNLKAGTFLYHKPPFLKKARRTKEMTIMAGLNPIINRRWLCYLTALLLSHFNSIYSPLYGPPLRPANILFFLPKIS
jgi:hypothetical protein